MTPPTERAPTLEQVQRDRELIERAIATFATEHNRLGGTIAAIHNDTTRHVQDKLAPLPPKHVTFTGWHRRRLPSGKWQVCRVGDHVWTDLPDCDDDIRALASLLPENAGMLTRTWLAWRCTSCGCLWRDNLDGSVSLLDTNQKSCDQCEHRPTRDACLVAAVPENATPAAQPAPTPRTFTLEELLEKARQIADEYGDFVHGDGYSPVVAMRTALTRALTAEQEPRHDE